MTEKTYTDDEMIEARQNGTVNMLNNILGPDTPPKRGRGRPPKVKLIEDIVAEESSNISYEETLFREAMLVAMRNRNVLSAKDVLQCVPVAWAYVDVMKDQFQ